MRIFFPENLTGIVSWASKHITFEIVVNIFVSRMDIGEYFIL